MAFKGTAVAQQWRCTGVRFSVLLASWGGGLKILVADKENYMVEPPQSGWAEKPAKSLQWPARACNGSIGLYCTP